MPLLQVGVCQGVIKFDISKMFEKKEKLIEPDREGMIMIGIESKTSHKTVYIVNEFCSLWQVLKQHKT